MKQYLAIRKTFIYLIFLEILSYFYLFSFREDVVLVTEGEVVLVTEGVALEIGGVVLGTDNTEDRHILQKGE